MCQFKSFICTEKKLYVTIGVNSHEDIIDIFNLKDDPEKIVRLELIPNKYTLEEFKNVDRWKFNVDQDKLPGWFIPMEWEEECKKWMKKNIIFEDKKIIHEQIEVYCGKCEKMVGNGSITILLGSISKVYGFASIAEVYGSASIAEVYGFASISKVYDSASIAKVCGSASIARVRGSASIKTDYRIKGE